MISTGIATDFEHLYEHECSFLEENQFTSYFKQHNIIERANRDKYINKNGKNLIELCKMSDLKIVNGRIGKDKYGEYTCQTKQGQSTIDYANNENKRTLSRLEKIDYCYYDTILRMTLFHYSYYFYVIICHILYTDLSSIIPAHCCIYVVNV